MRVICVYVWECMRKLETFVQNRCYFVSNKVLVFAKNFRLFRQKHCVKYYCRHFLFLSCLLIYLLLVVNDKLNSYCSPIKISLLMLNSKILQATKRRTYGRFKDVLLKCSLISQRKSNNVLSYSTRFFAVHLN